MDDIPLCPEWWPHMLWRLHFPLKFPHGSGGPGGPVNYPPAMNDILSNLHIHTLSYLIEDKSVAQQMRSLAEKRLVEGVQNLSRAHDQAVAKNK